MTACTNTPTDYPGPYGQGQPFAGQPVKILIDTDPGIDDAMAVLYAALAPEVDLIALTTVYGNVPVEIATRNALRLVELTGLDIPVAQGAARPMVLALNSPPDFIHGAEGFGAVPAVVPKGQVVAETAAELMCRLAREQPGELVVCAIGPITNVAEAVRLDADFARNVRQIVFMGGAAFVPGNVTRFAEANTHNDPHALNVVIRSGARVVMVGLDVTMQAMCNRAFFARLAESSPKLGGFLKAASDFYLDFYLARSGQDGCALHDPTAVIACTHPHLFRIQSLPLTVTESGEEIGRTVAGLSPAGTDRLPLHVDICTDGDMEAVKELFAGAFGVC